MWLTSTIYKHQVNKALKDAAIHNNQQQDFSTELLLPWEEQLVFHFDSANMEFNSANCKSINFSHISHAAECD